MSEPPGAPQAPRNQEILGWLFTAVAVLYAFAIHHGLGPAPLRTELAWYEPRTFLYSWEWIAWAFETSRRLIVVLTLPAVALTVAVFLTGRSAVARGLALSSVVGCVLFAFYGDVASGVWEFFFWRASAVLTLMSLVVGFALAAPFLAESWLRLSWPLRLLVYLPVFGVIVAFIRNATGTDLDLRFAISPWPAVPVFGMEVGALFALVWLLGAALGAGGIALARSRGAGPAAAAAGVVLGIAVPPALLYVGSALSLLPFRAGPGTLLPVAVACAVAIALSATLGVRGRPEAMRQRALHLAVGAAMVAAPLLAGQLWARWDYYRTREHLAGEVIDALESHLEKMEVYPDELDELVAAGFLEEVPVPAIGFTFLYDGKFRYRGFGSSYILEFPAPRWVECAYSPPYDEYEGEEEEEELEPWEAAAHGTGEGNAAEDMDGAWSCPSEPPELW